MNKLLLIPGTLCDKALWQPIIKELGSDCACEVVDISMDTTIEECRARVAQYLGQGAHIMGLSLGSWVALSVAECFPNLCTKLILVSSAPGQLTEHTRDFASRAIDLIGRGRFEEVIQQDIAIDVADIHKDNKELIDTLKLMMLRMGPEAAMRQYRAILSYQGFTNLKQVCCPTLILRGQYDVSVHQARQAILCKELPDARIEIIPNSSHYIPLENPTAMAATVRRFLFTP